VIRTRAQRRYRRKGYTYEIAYLREPFDRNRYHKVLILIVKGHRTSWRENREHLMEGEFVRPIAVTYLNNGRKPTARRRK
jgi:hypothetical protein